MQIPDLVNKVKETIVKNNNKKYACHVNRASSIGYFVSSIGGCLRRGVYERTHWEQKESWDDSSIIRFQEGNLQEKQVLKDLAEADIEVIEQQSNFVWREYKISGHLDGVVVVEGKAVPIEIKSMSPNIFSIINSFEDFKKKSWTRAYMAQIMTYMLMKDIDKGIFILKDKSSGDLKQINVDLDYELAEDCIKTAEAINKHVDDKTLPKKITEVETCKDCPFKLICCPDINFGAPLKIVDDPEFEKRIDRALEIKPTRDEYEKLWGLIKDRAKASLIDGELNEMVGKYRVHGKANAKGALTTKIDII